MRRKSKDMANPTKIPFLDLVTPHQELQEELLAVVKKAFSNAGFIGGLMGEGFEREVAAFCGARYCVRVDSRPGAFRVFLLAAGRPPGDNLLPCAQTLFAAPEIHFPG